MEISLFQHVVVQRRALASAPVIQCLVSVFVCQTLWVRGVIAAVLGHMAFPSAKVILLKQYSWSCILHSFKVVLMVFFPSLWSSRDL